MLLQLKLKSTLEDYYFLLFFKKGIEKSCPDYLITYYLLDWAIIWAVDFLKFD